MEINRVTSSSVVKKKKTGVSQKKDFSQSFNFSRERKNEQQLKKIMEDIKKKGDRLCITKCYTDVKAYKRMIREYLESVMSYMYSVKKDISFWQTQYFVTVDKVDIKLEELTQMLLDQEKENLNIAATIDDITGLLVDIYK